jgi:hypothetical protein
MAGKGRTNGRYFGYWNTIRVRLFSLKYKFLFFTLFFSTVLTFGQSVFFQPQLFDFSIIHENNGIVYHEFKLKNSGEQNYKVRGIINSCGCTNVDISSDSLLKNRFIRVRAGYDPANRPGNFFKQISIVLGGLGSDTLVVDAYIKGTVLSKNEVAYNPLDYKKSIIQIKPLVLFSEKTENNKKFNDFVNDITMVIDKDGFVNIRIEKPTAIDSALEIKIKSIKRNLLSALVKRGYKSNPVGFIDTLNTIRHDSLGSPVIAVLKVSNYNKDNIHESNIMLEGLNNFGTNLVSSDSATIRYSLHIANPQQKVEWAMDKSGTFVTQIVRTVLMTGSANIGIYVKGLIKAGEESFLKRILDTQIKNLAIELKNQGIEFDKINILVPVFLSGDKYEMSYNIVEFSSAQNFVSWNKFQFHLDSIRKEFETRTNSQKGFKNNIPVYYQRVENQNEFDTSNVHFKQWFNLFADAYKTNKKLKILVEATASNAPTTKAYDNSFVARRRATTTVAGLKSCFTKAGIVFPENLFMEPYALVKGPLYHEQDFLIHQYKKYQYIKLIPVENDSLVFVKEKAIPYQVNFSNNDFLIPATSAVFQNFIDNLIPSIKKYGYVEVILESSASKVPLKNYNSNRVLAFERLQNSKEAVLRAVAEKGYNPLRVIFTEERLLVQGPAFKQGMDPQNPLYSDYQYIKIIPKSLINR